MATPAPLVRLRLPVVLEPVVGCDRLELPGSNILEVLEAAFAELPVLRHHLMLDSGKLRPHVLCLHNGTNVARHKLATTAVTAGDEVFIHQAISGG